jgi:hypothetical protein
MIFSLVVRCAFFDFDNRSAGKLVAATATDEADKTKSLDARKVVPPLSALTNSPCEETTRPYVWDRT